MNKIRLDLGGLRVESFQTAVAEGTDRGTVHGFYSQRGTCDGRAATCQYGGTCGNGCPTGNCASPYCL